MTSTDTPAEISRISRRLPPLTNLLDNTLDEALRARRRRVMMADNPATSLIALRVTDDTLDRLVSSAGLYGEEAIQALDARIAKLSGDARDAAVFLRVAVAVHTREAALVELVARHVDAFPRAVREACWFYPVPDGPFSDRADYLLHLFEASANSVPLRRLAIELAGLRDERRLSGQLQSLLENPEYTSLTHTALARMGQATSATRRYVAECLASGDPQRIGIAMDILACDPRVADDGLLQTALKVDTTRVASAWAIATSRDARAARDLASSRQDISPDLHARIVALAGYPADIIAACGAMAAADGPVTSVQADLLELTLGGVPMEARCDPNDKTSKSGALRALLLRAFRHAHVGVCNDADIAPWDAGAILANPAQAAKVRLREGRALPPGVPALGRATLEVSQSLRRWLYIERASSAGHALALSPVDVARRQESALMVADFADAMR